MRAFLAARHASPVEGLEPLSGGFWSSAWAYRADGRELVLRVSDDPEGFEMDRAAMAHIRPGLPVPKVLDVDRGFGKHVATSERHHGRFLEYVDPGEADVVGPTIVDLLHALRAVPDNGVPDAGDWHEWLLAALTDDPDRRVSGWRSTIAGDPDLDAVFSACEERIESLLPRCPKRRDLVHSDLLHHNVLLSPAGDEVTAVFSWKCSTRGDFLYDTAWCTFWGAWHEGIGAADVWTRMTSSLLASGHGELLVDAAERHHAYELQIGAHHMGWYVWTQDGDSLRWLVGRLQEILDRGPMPLPS